jgi:capsule polysaccharide export protein KpsE/RkpR
MEHNKTADIIEVSFFELLLAIAKRKKFVISFTMAAVVLATAISFIIPREWKSQALVSPIADNTSGIQINPNVLSSFGNMPLLGSQKMELALEFLTIMDSRTFREDIIRRFHLIDYFRITRPDSTEAMDIALRKYNDRIFRAALEQQTSTIQMSVFTRDKNLSKDIADYILISLENYVKYQKKVKSTMTREFLEQRTAEVKTRLDTLLAQRQNFERTGKSFSLTEQTTQSLNLYTGIVSQKLLNDIELEIAIKQYGISNPKVRELEEKGKLLSRQLDSFDSKKGDSLPKYIIDLEKIPDAKMEYAKFLTDLNVMEQIYRFIYPMLESARLVEQKNMPEIEILDRPSLAGLHAYPKRLLLIISISLAALLFACLLAVIDEFISTEQKDCIKQISQEFSLKQKKKVAKVGDNEPDLHE